MFDDMSRTVIEIAKHRYQFMKCKEGEKSCLKCDVINYCLDPNTVPPCYGLFTEGDWYLKRIGDAPEGDE